MDRDDKSFRSDREFFREPVPMYDIQVRFRPSKPVKEIHLMRSGEKIKFRQNDGWIECNVPKIDDFEIILAFISNNDSIKYINTRIRDFKLL